MNEETLFHTALAKSSLEARAAFLDEACAGKPELRSAVEALLAAHEASGAFLNSPAAANATGMHESRPDLVPSTVSITAHYERKPGAEILIAGRYTLQQKIGEGGMGEVWVAKQSEPVKRKVALKLIKPGMDSRAVLARFEQERQALAMMDHPNIAKVLDAGMTPNGQPFFVMELVNGLPLNKFCDEARLKTNERLELFATICQAVQHAHQKGIVHRDLKPANILVTIIDGKPVPKVIDFGVAKATAGRLTDESMSTQFGAVVGTLEYMSPEQAGFSGEDIDTRADIYSLGVILYELLTGLRPIDAARLKKAALTEMIRIIREEEPSKPSTRLSTDEALPSMAALRQIDPRRLMALLRGDLDWVVMKCLEKHRERRYETANALARDVQRYLNGDAVEACPPSVGYRMGKFLKRNKGKVLAASFVFLALLAGFIGTAWGLVRADRARQAEAIQRKIAVEEKTKAEASEALAKEQRGRAESREQQAIDAVKRFRDAVADNPELKNNPALEPLRKTLLKEPLAFFKALRDRLQADRDTRLESLQRLAAASHDLGDLTKEIGDNQDALIAYREALAIRLKLADANPTSTRFQGDLATSHLNLGIVLSDTGKPGEAMKALESALATFQKLADANPTATQFQSELARTHMNIGIVLSGTGKPGEAMRALESALAIQQKLVDANPTDDQFWSDLSNSQYMIGDLLVHTGKPGEALKAHESALAIRRKLADANPTSTLFQSTLAGSHNNIGNLLKDTGKPGEALKAHESALAIRQKLVDANPTVTLFQRELAGSYYNIAKLLYRTGKPGEAMKACESALAIEQKLVDANPTVTEFQYGLATSYNMIGIILSDGDKPGETMKAYESALAIQQKLVDANPTVTLFQRELAASYNNIGALLSTTGKPVEALRMYETALPIRQKLARENPESPEYASLLGMQLGNIAAIDLEAGRVDAGHDRLQQAVVWQKKALATNARDPQYRQHLRNNLVDLLNIARSLGNSEGVAEAECELAKLHESDPAMKALDARLAAIIKGDQQPKDNAERLQLAQTAYDKALHATAARLWAEALAADPKLGDDRRAQHRYNAACAAALAASGLGKDDPNKPDAAAKAKLRKQALDWLRAELSAWKRISMIVEPGNKELVAKTLAHWKGDGDLAGIRDEQELAKLPEAERKAWQTLWADVDALLAKTKGR